MPALATLAKGTGTRNVSIDQCIIVTPLEYLDRNLLNYWPTAAYYQRPSRKNGARAIANVPRLATGKWPGQPSALR
eukprot:8204203-Pyramimonas_sp.AAC.1